MKKYQLNQDFFKRIGVGALATITVIHAALTLTNNDDLSPNNIDNEVTTSLAREEESEVYSEKESRRVITEEVIEVPTVEEVYAQEIEEYKNTLINLTTEELYETFLDFLNINEANLGEDLTNLKLKAIMGELDRINANQDYYDIKTLRFLDNTTGQLDINNILYLVDICYQNENYNIYRYFLDNGEPAWCITTKEEKVAFATTYEKSCIGNDNTLISLKDYLTENDLNDYLKMKYTLGDLVITLFGINDKVSTKFNSSKINTSDILLITQESLLDRMEGNIDNLYILIPKEEYLFGTNIVVYKDIINTEALIKVATNKKGFEYLDFTNLVSMSSYHNGDSMAPVFKSLEEVASQYNLENLITENKEYSISELTNIYGELKEKMTVSLVRK